MEELTKMHVDWKKTAVVVALVILTGLTVGGTTWYFADAGAQDELEAYKNEIATLQTEVAQIKANSTAEQSKEQAQKASSTITKTAVQDLLAKNNVNFNIPAKYASFDNLTSNQNEDANLPWYSRSDFSPLALHLGESEVGGVDFMIYKTTDINKLKATGGWESCTQVANEKIGLWDVLVFKIDNNQYMKIVINEGKSYVFGYPTQETIEDMNLMISTLEFK
jgi:predicted membrane-bound mannosyltransferase